jgi:shikimate 5-dehydrogenase
MLLYQAVAAFELWHGMRPDVTPELRAHVLKIHKDQAV